MTEPLCASLGLSVWDVEFKKEGKTNVLRVYIDKEGGVSIDDCEAVSVALSEKLDERDPIPTAYSLEVSSAGLDRQLKRPSDFLRYIGHQVDVKLYGPMEGLKDFTAELKDFKDETIFLNYEGKAMEIPLSKTVSVRLAVIF
ncbi:MAG: ribosome maturation factor RimP [Ruminococcaceae bacterium]|nr:ribosome maturation factor RimP [Oscillospiraceae bacterium]